MKLRVHAYHQTTRANDLEEVIDLSDDAFRGVVSSSAAIAVALTRMERNGFNWQDFTLEVDKVD